MYVCECVKRKLSSGDDDGHICVCMMYLVGAVATLQRVT